MQQLSDYANLLFISQSTAVNYGLLIMLGSKQHFSFRNNCLIKCKPFVTPVNSRKLWAPQPVWKLESHFSF